MQVRYILFLYHIFYRFMQLLFYNQYRKYKIFIADFHHSLYGIQLWLIFQCHGYLHTSHSWCHHTVKLGFFLIWKLTILHSCYELNLNNREINDVRGNTDYIMTLLSIWPENCKQTNHRPWIKIVHSWSSLCHKARRQPCQIFLIISVSNYVILLPSDLYQIREGHILKIGRLTMSYRSGIFC